MFILKKLLFKFMEVGLGLRTCFSLETKNPIFINFKLSDVEAEKLKRFLPPHFQLQKIRFAESDETADFWLSYNLYEIQYPKRQLEKIHKVRCEINTFVLDPLGRRGVYVFCGSPYVSREEHKSMTGWICDLAEYLVSFIYGCGKLIRLTYSLTQHVLEVHLKEGGNLIALKHRFDTNTAICERLSNEYWIYNDISLFNEGKTFDLVNVNSAFLYAKFGCIEGDKLEDCQIENAFFRRKPDRVYFHRGSISYLVNSLNRTQIPKGLPSVGIT